MGCARCSQCAVCSQCSTVYLCNVQYIKIYTYSPFFSSPWLMSFFSFRLLCKAGRYGTSIIAALHFFFFSLFFPFPALFFLLSI